MKNHANKITHITLVQYFSQYSLISYLNCDAQMYILFVLKWHDSYYEFRKLFIRILSEVGRIFHVGFTLSVGKVNHVIEPPGPKIVLNGIFLPIY